LNLLRKRFLSQLDSVSATRSIVRIESQSIESRIIERRIIESPLIKSQQEIKNKIIEVFVRSKESSEHKNKRSELSHSISIIVKKLLNMTTL
jgi:hypothetical protein